MPKVRFTADSIEHDAASDDWLYDVCVDAKASIPFACKAGACGTCATEVLEDSAGLGPPTQRELRTLAERNLDAARFRLPCLCTLQGDVTFGRSANAVGAARDLAIGEAEVESHRRLNLTVCEVRFFVRSSEWRFDPGQYVIFQIPAGKDVVRRSYSMSTPPSDARHFEICVRAVAGGHGSNWVHRLKQGQLVRFEGPMGDFKLRGGERDILMVATGTGMSPIKSMLMHLLEQRSNRRVRLFFGVRSVQDLFYTDFLRGLAAHYPSFESHLCLSSPDPSQWAGPRARVTDLVRELVAADDQSEAYLCGSQAMITDVTRILGAKGFPSERIHHENFY
jgi:Na+-transporting NADH:ubiquinone oxidoreductase subunit F